MEGKQNILEWIKVKPIPTSEKWFEEVWQDYRNKEIIRR